MIHPRTTLRHWLAIGLCLGAGFASVGRSQSSSAPLADASAGQMAAEVREIVESGQLPRSAQERRIASVVRTSVAKATGRSGDQAEQLEVAARLTETAVRLAPEFAEAIAAAVALAPAVARAESGPAQVRAAALAAAAEPRLPRAGPTRDAPPAVKPARKRPPAETDRQAKGRRPDQPEPLPNTRQVAGSREPAYHASTTREQVSLTDSTVFNLTAALGVEHDDNIFLDEASEADTIIRTTPGISFGFGRSSLVQGDLSYQHSFVRYAGNTVPNVSLGYGSARFGYEGARFSLLSSLSFQQLNQNTRETAGLRQPFIRRDIFALALNTETGLSAKTSLSTGLNLNNTGYKRDDLIGTRQTEVPLRFNFALTPKTSLSVGTSYRNVKPKGQDAGGSARDLFHNVGLHGTLAPKLTGALSVGYRTRKTDENAGDHLLGFDGSLNLALTPKSSLSLLLARDFGVGPRGESLHNNRSTLRFSVQPTDQWTLGTALSHFTTDYGLNSLTASNQPVSFFRTDRYWEGSLLSSYLFTSWFSASVEYTLRRNNSNDPIAEFSNKVLNLNFGFKY